MDVYRKIEGVTLFGDPMIIHEIRLGDHWQYIAMEHDRDWFLVAEVFARSFKRGR